MSNPAAVEPDPTAPPLCAIRPTQGLAGRLRVAGDGAIGHPALVLAALAVGRSEIGGLPAGEDTGHLVQALRALGATLHPVGEGRWQVQGRGIGGLVAPDAVLECGAAGDIARLLCGVLSGHPVFAVLAGAGVPPLRHLLTMLAGTGARFTGRAGGRLPLAVEGTAEPLPLDATLPPGPAALKPALLLAGLCARGTTRLEEAAATPDHAEILLRHFGATLRVEQHGEGRVIRLDGQPELRAADVAVPGDPAEAAGPLLAALLLPGSCLTVEALGLNPLRTGFLDTLREMGADLATTGARLRDGEWVGEITATHGPLRGVDVPAARMAGMVREFPLLAVACAHASGPSRLRGLGAPAYRLAGHHPLAATLALLAAHGVASDMEGDDLILHRNARPPAGSGPAAPPPHRDIGAAALVLGLAAGQGIDAGLAPGLADLLRQVAGPAAVVA